MNQEDILNEFINSIYIEHKKSLQDFFSENYSEKWMNMSENEKDDLVNNFISYSEKFGTKEVGQLLDLHQNFENNKINVLMLFLGLFLGIFGNLAANILERYFSYLGWYYIISVTVILCITLYMVYILLIKKKSKNIDHVEKTSEIAKVMKRLK